MVLNRATCVKTRVFSNLLDSVVKIVVKKGVRFYSGVSIDETLDI